MSQILVNNLTFYYDGGSETIFDNVNLNLDSDWKLGFCGRNGRGKTTFLKLLTGEYEYLGSIAASVKFLYFPFTLDLNRDAIDIAYEINPDTQVWRLSRELNLLSLDPECLYRQLKTMSEGERTKFMLALLFTVDNGFLLLDEPTNHLDREGRQVLSQYLNSKKGFILVSHDREVLNQCTEYTLNINRNDIELVGGSFGVWYDMRLGRERAERDENKRLKGEITRLMTAAERALRWADEVEKSKKGSKVAGLKPDRGHLGHLSQKAMKRAKSIEKRKVTVAEEKSRLLTNVEVSFPLKLNALEYHSELLISLKDVSIKYGDKCVVDKLTFDIRRGERVALKGGNGSGKSSVIKAILGHKTNNGDLEVGERMTIDGNLEVDGGLIISYLPQSISLSGSLRELISLEGGDETLCKSILNKMGWDKEQFDKRLESLSVGNQKKVRLAISLSKSAHLYIWDEPLNYIDIYSRLQIEQMENASLTLLFVEHDNVFCDKVATKIIEL